MKNVGIAITLIAIISGGIGGYWYYTNFMLSTDNIIKLEGQAGVYGKNGFQPFDLWSVNSRAVTENDSIYWRFWLVIRRNVSATIKEVRFNLSQTAIFPDGNHFDSWYTGTEGTSIGAFTSPNENWFLVSLPANTPVIIPIKYRDNRYPPTEHAPYSYADPSDETKVLREARVEKLITTSWQLGTTSWTMYCEVLGVVITNGIDNWTLIPPQSTIYWTFNITRSAIGSQMNIVGQKGYK